MRVKHRSQLRADQINTLKSHLQEWRDTRSCRDKLLDLNGTKSLPTIRELAGSLNGDRRIEKRYIPTPGKNEWRWKEYVS